MTTTQKIIFTPAAQQDTTASASQNREHGQAHYEAVMDEAERKALGWESAKPDDARAAGAHTPETDAKTFTVHHKGINNAWETQEVSASFAKKLERERDQAREQVKTLLAACKKGMELQGPGDIWSVDPGKMDAFKRAAQAAIASVESEQAK